MLEAKAIRLGWNIPEDLKADIIEKNANIIRHSDKERNVIAATRTILAANQQTIEATKAVAPQAPVNDNRVIVQYVDDWFYTPSEQQLRELKRESS